MKKFIFAALAVLLALSSIASIAYAQGQKPPTPNNPQDQNQRANGRGWRAGAWLYRNSPVFQEGVNLLAEKLGLSEQDLQSQLESGKSLLEIAQAQGFSQSDLNAILKDVEQEIINQAVDTGKLTQEQADRIHQRAELGLPGGILSRLGTFLRSFSSRIFNFGQQMQRRPFSWAMPHFRLFQRPRVDRNTL
jgi:hypothetical protein